MLLKAEEFWVQGQKDSTLLPPHSEEHCEDINQDVSMLVKKLYVCHGELWRYKTLIKQGCFQTFAE